MKSCIICDHPLPAFFLTDLPTDSTDVIVNQNTFESFDFSKIEIIYILAELQWNTLKRTDFYGFQLAKELRVNKKSLCPIVMCSFLPDDEITKLKEAKILDTPGHYSLQLPDKLIKLPNYLPIDEDLLYDISMHIFDFKGRLRGEMHDLVSTCNALILKNMDKEKLKSQIISLTKSKLSFFKEYILEEKKMEYALLAGNMLSDLEKFPFDEISLDQINNFFEIFKVQMYTMMPSAVFESNEVDFPAKRWGVLFIDDMKPIRNKVKEMFAKRGIVCHTAENADEAFKILLEDEKKHCTIAVIISDFRLYQNGQDGKWQNIQGFQILKAVNHQPEVFKSHYTYSILTSRKGTILDLIKKNNRFPITWFHKSDVISSESAFNIFYQRICELGTEAFYRKHYIPNNAIWQTGGDRVDHGYYYYYKQHIESVDFEYHEREINTIALKNIKSVENSGKLINAFAFQISLKSKEKKNTANNSNDLLAKFRYNILITRRIYMGLCFLLGIQREEIFKIFKSSYDEKGENSEREKGMNNAVLLTSLGISNNITPSKEAPTVFFNYGLLNEEIKFLEQNTKAYNKNLGYIRSMNENYNHLKTFFFLLTPIAELDEVNKKIPELKEIIFSFDINEKYRISLKVLKSCVGKINRIKYSNGSVANQFKKATNVFYKSTFFQFTSNVQDIIGSLKHWQ